MRAIIFANGDLNPGPLVDAALHLAPESLIVAADGGAHHAEALGLRPHIVLGDMDSLSGADLERYRAQGIALRRHPEAKDETDLELALLYAAGQGATWLRVLGGVGGRLDQTLGNVLLLTLEALAGRDARLVAGRQEAWILGAGEHAIQGSPGDTLSLLPLGGDAQGVESEGLKFPLRRETLRFGPARGMSNVLTRERAVVRLAAGMLLAVHTLGRA